MAEPILYMGPTGVGKSSSLRTLPPKETLIIKPNAKSFPFPGGDAMYTKENKNLLISNELDALAPTIQHVSDKMAHIKYLVLEDFTHHFTARIFSPAFTSRNTGGEAFQRWNDFGESVFGAIFAKSHLWREDLTIIVIHHTEIKEDGSIGFKSAGKLLDNTIDFPSYFTYVLHGTIKPVEKGVEYLVQTNLDGIRQAKTPYGVFDKLYIPNDMLAILNKIKDYKEGRTKVVWK